VGGKGILVIRTTLSWTAVAVCLSFFSTASPAAVAAPTTEYTVGDGGETAYLAVDFGEAGDDYFWFGFRFDGGVTADTALAAIVGGGGVDATIQSFSIGDFVHGLSYGSSDRLNAAMDFDDAPSMYHALGGSGAWSFSALGINDLTLDDGDAFGFAWVAEPRNPAPVPEPGAMLVLAVAGGVVALRRRRGRRRPVDDCGARS